jgi:ankyrin repeat protein
MFSAELHRMIMLTVRRGHNNTAKRLLLINRGLYANKPDSSFKTALHVAGTVEMVELLLKMRSSVFAEDIHGRTPLHYARNADIAGKLLDAEARTQARDHGGIIPLLWTGRMDVAEKLLSVDSIGFRGSNERTILMMAAYWNNLAMVKSVLEMASRKFVLSRFPALINAVDCDKRNAVSYAAMRNSSFEVFQALIGAGVDADPADKHNRRPLQYASNCDVIRLLVSSGASVNSSDNSGVTALHNRCHNGHTDAVKLLLSLNADAEKRYSCSKTVLMLAAEKDHVDIVNLLISHLPNLIDLRDDEGRTALFIALENKASRSAIALIDAGADVSICGDHARSPLIICSDANVAQLLLDRGADIHATDMDDRTALIQSSMDGHAEVVSLLIKNKADISVLDAYEQTALILASWHDRLDVVNTLLAANPSKEWIDATCDDGYTALKAAVHECSLDIVSRLLAAGAYCDSRSIRELPIHSAQGPAIAHMIMDGVAKDPDSSLGYTCLMSACAEGNYKLILWMSENRRDCDVNAVRGCATAISLALNHYRPYALRTLISAFPSINVNLHGLSSYPALHYAAISHHGYVTCHNRHPDTVKLLLDARADPTIVNNQGDIPLTYAHDPETIRLLIEAAPKTLHYKDNNGRNLLMQAFLRDDRHYSYGRPLSDQDVPVNYINQLLSKSSEYNDTIDVNDADKNGDTVLHMAMMALNVNAVDLLLCQGADMMGSGWQGTTVLMKALLDTEHDASVVDEFSDVISSMTHVADSPSDQDLMSQRCIKRVLSHIDRMLNVVTLWGPRTGSVRRTQGRKQPAAKRRKMY